MKSGQDKRKRERYSLKEAREALLAAYYHSNGNMQDYQRIAQATGLSPTEADEIARRRGWLHTKEGR